MVANKQYIAIHKVEAGRDLIAIFDAESGTRVNSIALPPDAQKLITPPMISGDNNVSWTVLMNNGIRRGYQAKMPGGNIKQFFTG